MSASASLSTRLRPGLFNFCRHSFGLKCSRTREIEWVRPVLPDRTHPFRQVIGRTSGTPLLPGRHRGQPPLRLPSSPRRAVLAACPVGSGPPRSFTTSHAPDDFFGLAFDVLDPPQWRTWFERLTPTGQVIRRNAVLLLKTLNPAPRWCGFPCRHTLKHLMPPRCHSCR